MSAEAQAVEGGGERPLLVLFLLGGLSLLAWAVLWRWGHSPYLHYVHHAHRHPAPGDGALFAATVFVGGWTLMTVAMMLPTSMPLLAVFSRVAAGRSDRALLLGLVVGGYLATWAAVGLLAYALALGLRTVSERIPWIGEHGWIFGALTLVGAGLYQFTPLKTRCLDRCRSPFSFVAEHWTGQHHQRQALWLGVHHGLFCVGCCWTLMLLMFPLGAGNLGWMLLLGALMATEKNLPWGRALARPLGWVLLGLGAVVLLRADAPLW
jgi:predicted metal-binding membrane protein